jgi:hypothetical protein
MPTEELPVSNQEPVVSLAMATGTATNAMCSPISLALAGQDTSQMAGLPSIVAGSSYAGAHGMQNSTRIRAVVLMAMFSNLVKSHH